ncbi:MAG: hypothetical protein IPM42_06770 [Saprospiraceae bacterium]|nr:hypothetical protein [Saprospiraceae bacterium]
MKILNSISLLALFIVIIFSSCQKENIDEIIPKDTVYQVDTIDINPMISQLRTSSGSIFLDCVEIPYPVDFVQMSGSTITINSDAELDAAIMLADSIVNFSYPFDAIVNNQTIIIEDIEDITIALIDCATIVPECSDLEPHVLLFFNGLNIFSINRYVYKINYPVSLIVEGNLVVINNDDEYLPAVTVGGNPSRLLDTELTYPITVRQFGQDIVLNNDNDVCAFYKKLDEPCENKPTHIQFFFSEGPGRPINCTYFINYPVTISLNGNNVQIQSREEYLNTLDSSPNAYNNITLVYPVSVEKLFGSPVTFVADADICQYLDNCQ